MVPDYEQLAQAASIPQPHIAAKDAEMWSLAVRATKALHPLLGPDAQNFACETTTEYNEMISSNVEPLEWNQLAEIIKCLAVRDLLPEGMSSQDQEDISRHAAWRWFEITRDERFSFLALHDLSRRQVDSMLRHASEPVLSIWSGHDFTLTGLLFAFQLEQPAVWPEYASYLKVELLEVSDLHDDYSATEHVVLFSMNGERLRSQLDGGKLRETIPLKILDEKMRSNASVAASSQ